MPKKNDLYDVFVYGYTHDGAGIAKADGAAVFIPGAAAGDRLRIRIIKALSNRSIARIEEIISPSEDRADALCPAFPACGGCDFRHITYAAELAQKKTVVADALSRLGGVGICADDFEIVPAPSLCAYRNKAVFPVGTGADGELVFGFYRKRSHSIVPCRACPIHPAFFGDAARAVLKYMKKAAVKPYDEVNGNGAVRSVYIRYGEFSGEVMVCLISARASLPRTELLVRLLRACVPGLRTVVLNHNPKRTNALLGPRNIALYGDAVISDTLAGNVLTLSPHSFYQVNRGQCEALYSRALDYAAMCGDIPNMRALDLFCGVGSITLMLARRMREVAGIEITPAAVENAKRNAEQNGIKNASFYCTDAISAPDILKKEGFSPDLIVVDPPRKGLSAEVCGFLINNRARFLIYISCEPATLARDVKILSQGGFSLKELTAFDMFPRTANVECAALLEKK